MKLTSIITREQIAARVAELGHAIDQTLPPGEILVIGVLRGAFVFMADLVRAIPREITCEFLTVQSYGDATETSGIVEIKNDLTAPIAGKHVLLVEDIVDTGLTLSYLIDTLTRRGPASLHVATALSKPSRRKVDVHVDFIGFEVPDHFIVGYGLDAAQQHRNLPYFAALTLDRVQVPAPWPDDEGDAKRLREVVAQRDALVTAGGPQEAIDALNLRIEALAELARLGR